MALQLNDWRLRVIDGADAGRELSLTGERAVIGAHPGCDLSLVSDGVRGRHMTCVRQGHGWRFDAEPGATLTAAGRAVAGGALRHGMVIALTDAVRLRVEKQAGKDGITPRTAIYAGLICVLLAIFAVVTALPGLRDPAGTAAATPADAPYWRDAAAKAVQGCAALAVTPNPKAGSALPRDGSAWRAILSPVTEDAARVAAADALSRALADAFVEADLHERAGDVARARAAYRRVLTLMPDPNCSLFQDALVKAAELPDR